MWNSETNPFLRMMAALDEVEAGGSGNQQEQQMAQHNRSGNVKLPDYWAHSPGIWFARVELRFEVCGIVSEREKFAHAVNALTHESSRLVTDLIISPPLERPYTILKDRLLLAHQLTPVQKAMKVMAMPGIGDRRPSQLLADMLEFCPAEEEHSAFFRAAFIQRLPAELQVLLDAVEDGDLKDLATKADKLWAIKRPAAFHLAAVDSEQISADGADTVAAVKQQGKGKAAWKATDKKKAANNNPKLFSLCYKHYKFGSDAFHCEDPVNCKWSGN